MNITTLLFMVFCTFVGMGKDSLPRNISSEDQVTTEHDEGFTVYMRYRELAEKERERFIEEIRNERDLSQNEQTLVEIVKKRTVKSAPTVTAQDDPAKISDAARAASELNERIRLMNQEFGHDASGQNIHDKLNEDERRAWERIFSEIKEKKRLRYQALGYDIKKLQEVERNDFSQWLSEMEEKDHLEPGQAINQVWNARIKDPARDNIPLQYTIRMNRTGKYKLGEPVFIGRYVKNLSDIFLWFSTYPAKSPFSTDRISLVDADGNEVPMTRSGKQEYEFVKNGGKETVIEGDSHKNFLSPHNLNQNHEKELQPVGAIVLNRYFDLSQPGVYHLTFHRFSFDAQKPLDEPLASNTLTIEVLDEPIRPEDLRDPGEFNWPPREKQAGIIPDQPPGGPNAGEHGGGRSEDSCEG